MQIEETIEDVLFVPNDYYIRLLIESNNMSMLRRKAVKSISVIWEDLKRIEKDMPVADIVRNTKLAFKK
jgi:hypothetical protein